MDNLSDFIWKWEGSQLGDDQIVTVADPNRYLLEFLAGGGLAIKADCNQARGQYTIQGDDLTIRLGPTTLVACPPNSQADEFLKELARVSAYRLTGDKLVFTLADDAGVMSFAAGNPIALSGTSWQVMGVNNGRQAVVSLIIGTTITLNFGADGRVGGSAGCNSYFGAYQTEGDQLRVGPLGSTRKMCVAPEGIMEQEAQFLAALQAGTTFRITGDRLNIRNAAGATQISARR